MRKLCFTAAAAALSCSALGSGWLFENLPPEPPRQKFGELKFTGGNITANRKTGAMSATGNVTAESGDYRFFSNSITCDGKGLYDFGEEGMLTTCSNALDKLHWKLEGHFVYEDQKSLTVTDAWLYFKDIPIFWVPWAYYPLNTNYGFRFLPGYTSKWGGFFLSGYVYSIHNEFGSSGLGLGGSSYFNLRTKNGVEVGQTLRWRFGEWGKGKIKGFYAWDEDYDRYERHWSDGRDYNYKNWGSEVERERYRVLLEHRSDFTERDMLNVRAQYLSDSHYLYDFFERDERKEVIPSNEAWYEHRENSWAAGASASGPLNDFYGGTARYPEAWLAASPQPLFSLPVNYESQTRAGFLNRQYSKYGSDDPMFRYDPYIGFNGRGADYQAFRADSAHRVSAPFTAAEILSIVPRAGYRATWWSDSGNPDAAFLSASDDPLYRGIAEIGFTISARATGWIDDKIQHIFEPYLDYSFQDVSYGGEDENRAYIFDNCDASVDWLDQFGFEGRGLPYNWHGIRPGVRNYLRMDEGDGKSRPLLDTDIYAAIPFLDEDYSADGHPVEQENGFYNRQDCVIPGFQMRFRPSNRITFSTRTEYDVDSEKVAYSSVGLTHSISRDFSWNLAYIGRDHRLWDYLPSEYDRWNEQLSNVISLGFLHQACEWFAWSPTIRWDARRNELDEFRIWFDYLIDCIGFRLSMDYHPSIMRVDNSKYDSDFSVGFAIYLRTLGTSSMMDFSVF